MCPECYNYVNLLQNVARKIQVDNFGNSGEITFIKLNIFRRIYCIMRTSGKEFRIPLILLDYKFPHASLIGPICMLLATTRSCFHDSF